MKNVIVLFFLFISVGSFGQNRSIGINLSTGYSEMGKNMFGYEERQSNVKFGIDYSQRFARMSSFRLRAIVTGQAYNSSLLIEGLENVKATDWINYIEVSPQYHFLPLKWLYLYGGLNAGIKVNSHTYSESLGGVEHSAGRPFQLEVESGAGVQFNFWKLTYRLGTFVELPIIHREYINLGLETGLMYNF